MNVQAEAANKIILNGLKKRLADTKGNWPENLYEVLWSYLMTPQSSIGETSFLLLYVVDVVITVEIREPLWRVIYTSPDNGSLLKEDFNTTDETCERARVMEMLRKK